MQHSQQEPQQRTTAENPADIANLFNRFFSSIFSSCSPPLYISEPDNAPVITDLTLTVDEVQSVLEKLDTTKATGPDDIPARLLRETAAVIAQSLCCLFNKSLRAGTLPDEWKLANIVSIYKKGNNEHTEL